MKQESNIYFPGLNGLRFIAALAVIITHLELSKRFYNVGTNYWKNPFIYNLGGLGVYFFFVLSGFLITYLLLAEKEKKGKIFIKEFYIRRILRIWPLYYFIGFLGFFVLPKIEMLHIAVIHESFIEHFKWHLILFLLILPNVAFSLFNSVPHIGQSWSIGVEEQFYIFWPWVISKSKNVIKSLLIILASVILFKVILLIFGKFYSSHAWFLPLQNLVAMSKFECMAIGGIGAHLLISKHRLLKILFNKYLLNISILLIPTLIFVPDFLQNGVHILFSGIFLIIILNVANGSVKLKLENKVLNYLGKISYGIYMYHFIIISVVLNILTGYLKMPNGLQMNLILYSSSILLTIAVSSLSFELVENKFIKLKSKFSIIKSGNKE